MRKLHKHKQCWCIRWRLCIRQYAITLSELVFLLSLICIAGWNQFFANAVVSTYHVYFWQYTDTDFLHEMTLTEVVITFVILYCSLLAMNTHCRAQRVSPSSASVPTVASVLVLCICFWHLQTDAKFAGCFLSLTAGLAVLGSGWVWWLMLFIIRFLLWSCRSACLVLTGA